MAVKRGLANIQETLDRENRGSNNAGLPKEAWFKLKDGEKKRVRFLQELDESAAGYNKEAGLGFLAVEHSPPHNWKTRIVCTAEEGECFGCEQLTSGDPDAYKWKPKSKLYINALVTEGDQESVQVFSQGMGAKSVTPVLLEIAGDAGTITGSPFNVKRTGSTKETTSYLLIQGPADKSPFDVSPYIDKLFDLEENAVRNVAYEDQEAEYMKTYGKQEEKAESAEIVW